MSKQEPSAQRPNRICLTAATFVEWIGVGSIPGAHATVVIYRPSATQKRRLAVCVEGEAPGDATTDIYEIDDDVAGKPLAEEAFATTIPRDRWAWKEFQANGDTVGQRLLTEPFSGALVEITRSGDA